MAQHDTEHAVEEVRLQELYRSLVLATSHSIRLLKLLPSKNNNEIWARLEVADLDRDPEYEALSYTWGASTACRSIFVNDKYQISVTDNLFNALKGLRTRTEMRTLWIDQLCINQLDSTERNSQVASMARIYSKAQCVNVWLGVPATRTFPLSLYHCLVALPKWLRFLRARRKNQHQPWFPHLDEQVWRGFKSSLRNHNRTIGKALKNTQPQWWTRVWVIQEFVLAQKVFLCCGQARFSYDITWLSSLSVDLDMPELQNLRTAIGHMERLRRDHSASEQPTERPTDPPGNDLHECLYRIRNKDATNPRDFVYGLLGLIKMREAEMMRPDYERSCAEIYANATFASILCRRNFDIFNFVKPGLSTVDLEIPSWSVDFADQAPHTGIVEFGDSIRSNRLQFKKPDLHEGGRHLNMSACVFGLVGDVVSINALSSALEQGSRESDLVVKAADRFLSNSPASNSRANVLHSLGVSHQNESFTGLPNDDIDLRFTDPDIVIEKRLLSSVLLWNATTGRHIAGPEPSAPYGNLDNYLHSYAIYARWYSGGVSVFATPEGIIGFGPDTIAEGDLIVQICSRRPFIVIRKEENEEIYKFQGQVWLHGFMDEQVINQWRSFCAEEKTVTLS